MKYIDIYGNLYGKFYHGIKKWGGATLLLFVLSVSPGCNGVNFLTDALGQESEDSNSDLALLLALGLLNSSCPTYANLDLPTG